MTKKIMTLALVLLMTISFTACKNDSIDAEFGWGTTENGRYENEFFGFSIDISEDYYFKTPQEIVDMNLIPGEDGEITPYDINSIEDLSAEPMVHYIYATKYESVSSTHFNPYINIFSENMSYVNSNYSKEAYVENSLNFTQMIFENAEVGVEVFPLEKPWFDDRQFAKGTLRIDLEQFTMFQEMYSIRKGDYSFVILLGYSTPTERDELHSYLDTLTIK